MEAAEGGSRGGEERRGNEEAGGRAVAEQDGAGGTEEEITGGSGGARGSEQKREGEGGEGKGRSEPERTTGWIETMHSYLEEDLLIFTEDRAQVCTAPAQSITGSDLVESHGWSRSGPDSSVMPGLSPSLKCTALRRPPPPSALRILPADGAVSMTKSLFSSANRHLLVALWCSSSSSSSVESNRGNRFSRICSLGRQEENREGISWGR